MDDQNYRLDTALTGNMPIPRELMNEFDDFYAQQRLHTRQMEAFGNTFQNDNSSVK